MKKTSKLNEAIDWLEWQVKLHERSGWTDEMPMEFAKAFLTSDKKEIEEALNHMQKTALDRLESYHD